jgi:hypothetical protein
VTTGSDLLAAIKRSTLRPVEQFGVRFCIRGLSGPERVLLVQRQKDGNPLLAAELVALAACDESGAVLFTAEQAAELSACGYGAEMEKVAEAILDASGLTAKAQEAAAKN